MSDAPNFDSNANNKDGARPFFYTEAEENKAESDKRGQPVWIEREKVRILIPGDRLTEVHRYVGEEHRKRWPREYADFKAGQDTPLEGTPISELPGISRARVEELRFAHVMTIEQLAELPDANLNKAVSMGGYKLREQAQRHLQRVAGVAVEEKLAAENSAKDARIAELEGQMADLLKRVDAMTAQAATGPAPGVPHT